MIKIFFFISLLLIPLLGKAYELKVEVEEIKSNRGSIKLALFPEESDFPGDYNSAQESAVVLIENLKAEHTFKNIDKGNYAVAVFHDLNQNEDLDTNFAGIPLEPFGLSNNPRLFGKPTFNKCKFVVDENKKLKIYLKKIF
jgi:uncharacterized protein (DUF2141 family)